MASLQHAPGKKRWLPLAISAIVAGVIIYNVLDDPEETVSPTDTVVNITTSDQSLEQAKREFNAGRYQDALISIERAIQDAPDSMDAKLLKASILMQTGHNFEAESLLNSLRESYPNRPEPLNNLAVIYAESGNPSRAIETLQLAFSTHSSYAKVYQNLSDMYAILAAEAYNKALDLPNNSGGPKLALIDHFGQPTAATSDNALFLDSAENPVAAPQALTPELARPIEPVRVSEEPALAATADSPNTRSLIVEAVPATSLTPPLEQEGSTQQLASGYTNVLMDKADSDAIVAAQDTLSMEQAATDAPLDPVNFTTSLEELEIARETKRAEALLASLESGADITVDEPTSQQQSTIEPVPVSKPNPVPVPEPEPSPEEAVEQHLHQWAKAWSSQDIKEYIRAYIAGYQPNTATSHRQWVKNRTSRLRKPDYIKISLRDIKVVMLSANQAEVTFRQIYRSDRYQDVDRKRMNMMRRSSGWKIVEEGKQ